ncbi:MAG: GlxA family transcriptional regulator [Curvibacter sp.]|nr:GlxA family transcriptional regulator [Curvibacter sp.]
MPHSLAILVFPDFQLLDLSGPLAAFEMAQRLRPGSYAWQVVAAQAGEVPSSAGLGLQAGPLPGPESFDTALVVGGQGTREAMEDPRLLHWVRSTEQAGRRLASVCSGSLVLAAAGVLQGRRATTHWSRSAGLRRRFPEVRLEADRIFVNDGQIWTSAGISAGIDLALALLTRDQGEALARQVAQQLVVYYRRPGGQSQFSELLAMGQEQGRFQSLLDEVRQDLGLPHRVADLAARACMSPRHFARIFLQETGHSPAHAVERLRVEAARAALESGAGSLKAVARDCGFGSSERMRRSFLRLLGMPPSLHQRGTGRPGSGATPAQAAPPGPDPGLDAPGSAPRG